MSDEEQPELSPGNGSLLMPLEDPEDPEQPALFSLPEPHEVDGFLAREGRYTAERLFLHRPDTYRMIVHLLGEGQSIRAIKRACRVHHETIEAVARRERMAVDTLKERTIANLRLGQAALSETLLEDIMADRIKPEAKAVTLAIMTDKLELLTGGVTARVETMTSAADSPRTWDEWMERMKRADMGSVGRKDLQMGGSDSAPGDGPVRVHRLAIEVQSSVLPEQNHCDTACDTDGDPNREDSAEGGGGGLGPLPPGDHPIQEEP